MSKRKVIFSVFSIAFLLVAPLIYFLPSPDYLMMFIIPLSVVAAVSFLRFNSFLATKNTLKTFLLWLVANVVFDFLYFANYVFNLGILRQGYGWYSDMAGFELFIIVPILLIWNAVTLTYVLITRKRINRGESLSDKNDKIWIATAIGLGILGFVFIFSSFLSPILR